MKTKSRVLVIMLSLVMIFAIFTGCNTNDNKSTPSNSDNEIIQEDPITLEIWHIQTRSGDLFDGIIERFESANPNIKVKTSAVEPDAYKEKLTVAMSSGTPPDVYISWSGGRMNEYVDAGLALDLTEYMNKDNFVEMFLEGAIAQGSYNGKIYGVPIENVSIAGFFYNKEIYEKYNLTEPKTIAELESNCDILVANEVTPFSLANAPRWTGSFYFMYLATRYGGVEPFQDAVSGEGSFDSEPYIFAGEKIQEWVNKGYFNEGFNGLDEGSGQSRQLMYAEECAMTLMGNWFINTVRSENEEFLDKVGYFLFPGLDASDADPGIVVGTLGDNFYHVSPNSENPDKAFELITYLLDEQAIAERKAEGRIIPIKGFEVDDPNLQIIIDAYNNAPAVQLWYDQYLPASVTNVHLDTCQALFGLSTTPEQAARDFQEAMASHLVSMEE